MMNTICTNNFKRSFAKIPSGIKELFAVQEKRFGENWRDARLHIKRLHAFNGVFSFRVTRNWRVLFYFQNPATAIFFEIDNRKDVYR